MSSSPRLEIFWSIFCQNQGISMPLPSTTEFGDTLEMRNDLCALVLVGRKRATAGLALWWGWNRATAPKLADLTVVLDGGGIPRCVIEPTEVREGPFHSVDAQFAADEGEGDGSRDYWIAEHRRFFTKELAAEGLAFSDVVRVIFERFRLVWQP